MKVTVNQVLQKYSSNWIVYLNNSHLLAFNISHYISLLLTTVHLTTATASNTSSIYFDVQNFEDQCASNRTGVLCGECKGGLSLMLRSNRCALRMFQHIPSTAASFCVSMFVLGICSCVDGSQSDGVSRYLFYTHMHGLTQ